MKSENPTPATPGTVTTVTRKIGSNRGKARLWIEGVCLSSQGRTKGTIYTRYDSPDLGVMEFLRVNVATDGHPKTARKVAGDETRPIIDTNSDTLLTTLKALPGDVLTITITPDRIMVRRYNPEIDDKAGPMTQHRTI